MLLFPGGGYEGGKRSRNRRANEKTATRAAFAAVTEHGARVSRTPKQKSKRKTTLRKQLKAKSKQATGRKVHAKAKERKQKPKA